MNKPRIKIYDSLFSHTNTMGNGDRYVVPKHFDWYRGDEYCNIAVFTDQNLDDVSKTDSLVKIALLMESPEIYPEPYEKILRMLNKFKYVLTFDVETIEKIEQKREYGNARPWMYHLGGCWIDRPDIYPKSKNISIIVSDKKTTNGHKLRHEIVKEYGSIVDVYGREYNPVVDKTDALRDYRYTIVVENCQRDIYFTEKLIDAFATGSMPIYWGCPSIKHFFGKTSIIPFDTISDLDKLLQMILINPEIYYLEHMKRIQRSFDIAQGYSVTEDMLWNNLFRYVQCTSGGLN